MNLSSDNTILFYIGAFKVNLTIITTWGLILFLALLSAAISSRLTTGLHISKWQGFLEMVVLGIKKQIEDIGVRNGETYINPSRRLTK